MIYSCSIQSSESHMVPIIVQALFVLFTTWTMGSAVHLAITGQLIPPWCHHLARTLLAISAPLNVSWQRLTVKQGDNWPFMSVWWPAGCLWCHRSQVNRPLSPLNQCVLVTVTTIDVVQPCTPLITINGTFCWYASQGASIHIRGVRLVLWFLSESWSAEFQDLRARSFIQLHVWLTV